MAFPETISFTRRDFPHWQVSDRPYFVTFRLLHSIPSHVLEELKNKKDDLIAKNADDIEMHEYQRYEFKKIERILDSTDNAKNCFLTTPEIASVIVKAFNFLEKKYCWSFPSYVVMPNHVHCLAIDGKSGNKKNLTEMIGLLKSYVSNEGNKILDRKGRMWCDENFDHWCRTHDKVEGVIRYIRNNPVKAGLVNKAEDWPWSK